MNIIQQVYTNKFTNIIEPIIYSGFKSIYDNSIKILKDHKRSIALIKILKIFLINIKSWEDSMIEKEEKRIINTCNCEYILDLFKAILKANIILLSNNSVDELDECIDDYSFGDFIHKVYINIAKKIYKNPLLINNDDDNDEFKNIIIDSIKICLYDILPYSSIIKNFLLSDFKKHLCGGNQKIIESILKSESNKQENIIKSIMNKDNIIKSESNKQESIIHSVNVKEQNIINSLSNIDKSIKSENNKKKNIIDLQTGGQKNIINSVNIIKKNIVESNNKSKVSKQHYISNITYENNNNNITESNTSYNNITESNNNITESNNIIKESSNNVSFDDITSITNDISSDHKYAAVFNNIKKK